MQILRLSHNIQIIKLNPLKKGNIKARPYSLQQDTFSLSFQGKKSQRDKYIIIKNGIEKQGISHNLEAYNTFSLNALYKYYNADSEVTSKLISKKFGDAEIYEILIEAGLDTDILNRAIDKVDEYHIKCREYEKANYINPANTTASEIYSLISAFKIDEELTNELLEKTFTHKKRGYTVPLYSPEEIYTEVLKKRKENKRVQIYPHLTVTTQTEKPTIKPNFKSK